MPSFSMPCTYACTSQFWSILRSAVVRWLVDDSCTAVEGARAERVRVLLRHSVVVASPKPIVIRGSRFLTIRFGTSVPK